MLDDLKREVGETVAAIDKAVESRTAQKAAHEGTKTALAAALATVAQLQAQVAAGGTIDQAAIDQMAADLDNAQKKLGETEVAGQAVDQALSDAPTPNVDAVTEPPADTIAGASS